MGDKPKNAEPVDQNEQLTRAIIAEIRKRRTSMWDIMFGIFFGILLAIATVMALLYIPEVDYLWTRAFGRRLLR